MRDYEQVPQRLETACPRCGHVFEPEWEGGFDCCPNCDVEIEAPEMPTQNVESQTRRVPRASNVTCDVTMHVTRHVTSHVTSNVTLRVTYNLLVSRTEMRKFRPRNVARDVSRNVVNTYRLPFYREASFHTNGSCAKGREL